MSVVVARQTVRDEDPPWAILGMPTRADRLLRRLGCKTVADLCNLTERDILRAPSFGRDTVGRIQKALAAVGRSLRGPNTPRPPKPITPLPLPTSLPKRVLLAELEIVCDRRKDPHELADRYFIEGEERVDFLERALRFQARARVKEKVADVETRLAFRGGDVVECRANSQDDATRQGDAACTGKERGK